MEQSYITAEQMFEEMMAGPGSSGQTGAITDSNHPGVGPDPETYGSMPGAMVYARSALGLASLLGPKLFSRLVPLETYAAALGSGGIYSRSAMTGYKYSMDATKQIK